MNDYEIKKLYEEMELHLIKSMKNNLGKHLLEEKEIDFEYPQWQAIKLKELKKYQKENKKIIGRYSLGLDKDVSEHLQNELKQGAINAINQYNNLNKKKLNQNKVMNKSFFKTNDKKVKALIKVVNDDLNTANASALRMINDQYRQIIHKSAFFVGNGVFTEQQAARMAVDEISEKKLTTLAVDEASKNFLAGGLNCIEYKNGRRVNIASYSQMAVRTASLRAQLMGEGDFRKSIGRTLVKVTTHGGACKLCTGWQGKVLVDDVYSGGKADGKHTLLSEAMKQGFLHPNCRHGLTTYYPELEEDEVEDDDNQELQEQINYYNRQEKKYNRLKTGSLNSDNRNSYKQKELYYNQKQDILDSKNTTTSFINSNAMGEKEYLDLRKGLIKETDEITEFLFANKENDILKEIRLKEEEFTLLFDENGNYMRYHKDENGNIIGLIPTNDRNKALPYGKKAKERLSKLGIDIDKYKVNGDIEKKINSELNELNKKLQNRENKRLRNLEIINEQHKLNEKIIGLDNYKYSNETLKSMAIEKIHNIGSFYISSDETVLKQIQEVKKELDATYELDKILKKEGLEVSSSPYSFSLYGIEKGDQITWDYKPEGSYRLSDHWNFESQGKIHCKLAYTNEYTQKMLLCQYRGGKYYVIKDFSK